MRDWIVDFMSSNGYLAIVVLMFLENIFPPIPSEVIMPLAGYTVAQGELNFIGAVAAGTAGTVLGALPLYFLGRAVGHKRLKEWAGKYGRWITVSPDELDAGKEWFDNHGSIAIIFCRLVPGVRSLISIPAGIDEMNFGVFLLYTTIGSGIWSAILAGAGYGLGENFKQVDKYMGPISYVVAAFFIITYIVRVIRFQPQQQSQNATQ